MANLSYEIEGFIQGDGSIPENQIDLLILEGALKVF